MDIKVTQEDLSSYYDISSRLVKKIEEVAEKLGKITGIEYKSFKIDVSSFTITYQLCMKEGDIIESKYMLPGEALTDTDKWLEKKKKNYQVMKDAIEKWWKKENL